MEKIKSYTDIEQSKKLPKILPFENFIYFGTFAEELTDA